MRSRTSFVYCPCFVISSQPNISILRQRICTPLAGIRLRRSVHDGKIDGTSPPELLTIRDIPAPHIGSIRVVGLNSPLNRNAISKQLLWELDHQIAQIASLAWDGPSKREGTRVLILASEVDEVFCAGADLEERGSMNRKEVTAFLKALRSMLYNLSNLNIPTIAAISSVALGGGLELALATTFRVLSSTATVGLPETRLGVIPGAGGTHRLKNLIGEARAQRMILTGCRITGSTAYDWGLCEWVTADQLPVTDDQRSEHKTAVPEGRTIPTEQVLDLAVDVAKDICRGAPVAVSAALTAVKMGKVAVANRMYERCISEGGRDVAEGLRAFGEKRQPRYRGAPAIHELTRASMKKELSQYKGAP